MKDMLKIMAKKLFIFSFISSLIAIYRLDIKEANKKI